MPEELQSDEQTQPASALPTELPRGDKTELAIVIARGHCVRKWARSNGVPERTAYRRASEPEVRRMVEICRRRTLDRAIGRVNRRTTWVTDRIALIAKEADSQSLQFRALPSIISDVMAVSKFSNIEHRLTELEEDFREQSGNPDSVA